MLASDRHSRFHAGALSAVVWGMLAGVSVWVAGPADAQVTITAQGEVPQSCTMTVPGTLALGDLADTATARILAVNVNCNTPWTYSLVSANGALVAVAPPAQVAGAFTTSLGYQVVTLFSTDSGSFGDAAMDSGSLTAANAAGCNAYAATTCPFADSGADVSIAQTSGSLTLSLDTPTSPLVAATYSDTLTLTVLVI
jgi:hypothetical protein